MIIYNITLNIEHEVLERCLDYLQKEFIPQSLSSGHLDTPRLRRILYDHTEDAASYALQFHVKDIGDLEEWLQKDGRDLQGRLMMEFGPSIIGFTTLLEDIALGF